MPDRFELLDMDGNDTPRSPELARDRALALDSVGLVALHEELVRGFEFWNRLCFEGRLTPIVFAFYPQPSRTSGKLGTYRPGAWRGGRIAKGESVPEIILYADLCLQLGPRQVFRTLVHEMVHHWQALFGEPGRKVHNEQWHAMAQACGLQTVGPKGYTEEAEGFKAAYAGFAPRVDAIPFREVGAHGAERQKGKMRKWACTLACNGSVRSGKREIYLTCGVCGETLKPQD